ncbi:hypothetical protein EVA_19397 [gut metagenome]|uniref:Uncharacterized protein n=1 Tax=gut metagenome TaxID=749906 RepID=J9FDL6_9ZZZZ
MQSQAHSEAMDMKRWAADVYNHLGDLGYPLSGLPKTTAFTKAYESVYHRDGTIREDVDLQCTAALRTAGLELDDLQDDQIEKPRARHYYKLRSFNDIFGHYTYRYNQQNTDEEGKDATTVRFVDSENDATIWRCTTQNGRYVFSTPQKTLHLGYVNSMEDSIQLDRGYTWGAFTLVRNDRYATSTMSKDGKYDFQTEYSTNPKSYRTNRDGFVSSDFQFIPVPFIEAIVPGQTQPDNVLPADGKPLTVEDTWKEVYAAKAQRLNNLSYSRSYTTTQWQPLYVPFALSYADWKDHWEVARIEAIRQVPANASGAGQKIEVTYRKIESGELQPNHPYLVRSLQTGNQTVSRTQAVFSPTNEQGIAFKDGATIYHLCGYYTESTDPKVADKASLLADGQFKALKESPNAQRTFRWTLHASDAQGTLQTLPQQIELVEASDRREVVGTLRINTEEGYGTIYTDVAYELPQAVTAYTVIEADETQGELTLQPAYEGGSVVPPHTPLVVKGERREYTLFAPASDAPAAVAPQGQNLLCGSATDGMTTGPSSSTEYYFYKLYYATDNLLHKRQLGFYWGAAGGAPFHNAGGKAYLALPVAQVKHSRGFLFPGHPMTGIETPVTIQPSKGAQGTYTLTGIKLSNQALKNLPAGIYIINGQKVVVK